MIDRYGRQISYLRVSVTQRCNLHCLYCGSECPEPDGMTAGQIADIVRLFSYEGIDKVRLTGGEPLLREDIAEIAREIADLEGIKKTALTTNGVLLAQRARELKEAGVNAVNVSLDTLDRERYCELTGGNFLPEVLKGVETALKEGLSVRINAVPMKGVNDSEAEQLILLAKDAPIDVRFIELMPFSDAGENKKLIVTGEELLGRFPFLHPVETGDKSSPSRYYEADGFQGKIGFITPVSDGFCDRCNRIRLLSDGKIRPCLGHEQTYDLKPFFGDEEKMREIIRQAIAAKPKGHAFGCAYGSPHGMNKIGG